MESLVELYVRLDDETRAVSLPAWEEVAAIKEWVEEEEGIPTEEQVVYGPGGRILEDEELVRDLNLGAGDALEVSVRIRGGKVHGSLARAGKVKGQTPKVEKQEKKKKKTGRAKRRMQYNRRFVNVVATFGRKRGPNANVPA